VNFDPSNEEWIYYIQRFELELSLHDILAQHNIKRNLLLKWIGPEPYRLVVDQFSPTFIIKIKYAEITAHFLMVITRRQAII